MPNISFLFPQKKNIFNEPSVYDRRGYSPTSLSTRTNSGLLLSSFSSSFLRNSLSFRMATNIAFSLSAPIRASSGSVQKPDPSRKKPGSSSSWWAPLFGWSSNPDYLNNTGLTSERKPDVSDSESDPGRSRSRSTAGWFTEEKAKQLRKKQMENAAFHDLMYHSAIASRMASDTSSWTGSD